MRIRKKRQSGFSLVELIVATAVLLIIMGAVFTQLDKAQSRYRVEDNRVDLTQQEREFIDQFTRDLHQAGFPTKDVYGNRFDYNSKYISAGLWSVTPTDIYMEGDLDDSGSVMETRYHYDDGSSWTGPGPNPCPCIRRSSVQKSDGLYPWDPNQGQAQYYTEVQNVIPPAVTGQSIFQLYDSSGQPVPIPTGGLVLGSGTTLDGNAQQQLQSIKAIRLLLTVQAKIADGDTGLPIQVTMSGTAHLSNN